MSTPEGLRGPDTINGHKTDWSSIRANFFVGLAASHMKDLSWTEQVTPTVPAGVHGIPLTSGLGFYRVTSATATITVEAWVAMLKRLGPGYTALKERLTVNFKPYGSKVIRKVRWHEARIVQKDDTHAQGSADGLWIKIGFNVRYIEEAGDDDVYRCMYPLNLDA